MADSKADKIYNDIFGDSDDDLEEENDTNNVANTDIQPVLSAPSSSKIEDDDIFASDDENDSDNGEISSTPNKLKSKSSSLSISSSEKKKLKKLKKKEKKKLKKKRERGDDDDDDTDNDAKKSKKLRRLKKKNKKDKEKNKAENNGNVSSGDEYGSEPEVERTAEDDAFIDKNNDDDDLVTDYNAQTQNFKDEKPIGDKIKKKSSDIIDVMLQDMKNKKVKELSEPQKEMITDKLIENMIGAAKIDDELFEKGQPATEKLTILPSVEKVIYNKSIQVTLLERNLLEILNTWISPRNKDTLAPPSIRSSIYRLLQMLPCQVDHLRRSGIGKTILALKKHRLETMENKKILREIIEKWSRPIFSQGNQVIVTNQELIRNAIVLQRNKTEEDNAANGSSKAGKTSSFAAAISKTKEAVSGRGRVRVPSSQGYMFTVQSDNLNSVTTTDRVAPEYSQAKTDLIKRMKSRKGSQ